MLQNPFQVGDRVRLNPGLPIAHIAGPSRGAVGVVVAVETHSGVPRVQVKFDEVMTPFMNAGLFELVERIPTEG
jgi:hypothetical protein